MGMGMEVGELEGWRVGGWKIGEREGGRDLLLFIRRF